MALKTPPQTTGAVVGPVPVGDPPGTDTKAELQNTGSTEEMPPPPSWNRSVCAPLTAATDSCQEMEQYPGMKIIPFHSRKKGALCIGPFLFTDALPDTVDVVLSLKVLTVGKVVALDGAAQTCEVLHTSVGGSGKEVHHTLY